MLYAPATEALGILEHLPYEYLQLIASSLTAFVASSGFWLYIDKRRDRQDFRNKLLIGLAHDRIVYLGMQYIHRRWITEDEYENLHDFLYCPYLALGGNGTAKKIMAEIEKLPIRKSFLEKEKNGDKTNESDV